MNLTIHVLCMHIYINKISQENMSLSVIAAYTSVVAVLTGLYSKMYSK